MQMRYFSPVKIHGVLTPCSERNATVSVCKDGDRTLKLTFNSYGTFFINGYSEYYLIAVLSVWVFWGVFVFLLGNSL